MNRLLRLSSLVLALAATLALTGCSDDNDNPVAPVSQASVMVVHASPDAPAVDLLVDNTIQGTNLAYPSNTAYLGVNAGTRNVKVNVTGTTTTVIRLPTTPLNVDVNACCAPITSVFSRDTSAPVCARVKKAIDCRCTWSKTSARRWKIKPSPMRADR